MSRRISVIMPSYNAAAYIGEAVGSILSQDFQDYEIVIRDAGSTDGTESKIRSFSDDRVRFYQEDDRGQSHALNLAVEKARGDWLLWLNADDLLCDGALSAAAACFDAHWDLIVGDFAIIDADGKRLKSYRSHGLKYKRLLANGCYVFSGSAFWKKRLSWL